MVPVKEFEKNIYFCFIDYANAFGCVDHNKMWKILQEKGIPDYLICLLRNLYAGQEATVRSAHETMLLLLLLLLSRFSRVRLWATPEMAAHQALPSLGFFRQEHWSGLAIAFSDETMDWFKIGKGVHQGCILPPCLFNL